MEKDDEKVFTEYMVGDAVVRLKLKKENLIYEVEEPRIDEKVRKALEEEAKKRILSEIEKKAKELAGRGNRVDLGKRSYAGGSERGGRTARHRLHVTSKDGATILESSAFRTPEQRAVALQKLEDKMTERATPVTNPDIEGQLQRRGLQNDLTVERRNGGLVKVKENGKTIAQKRIRTNGDMDDLMAKVDKHTRPKVNMGSGTGNTADKVKNAPVMAENFNNVVKALGEILNEL